jgi:hypothetical protein
LQPYCLSRLPRRSWGDDSHSVAPSNQQEFRSACLSACNCCELQGRLVSQSSKDSPQPSQSLRFDSEIYSTMRVYCQGAKHSIKRCRPDGRLPSRACCFRCMFQCSLVRHITDPHAPRHSVLHAEASHHDSRFVRWKAFVIRPANTLLQRLRRRRIQHGESVLHLMFH